jgi:hypothetical protein
MFHICPIFSLTLSEEVGAARRALGRVKSVSTAAVHNMRSWWRLAVAAMTAAVLALIGVLLCADPTKQTAYTFPGGPANAAIVVEDRASHQGDAHAVADRDADQGAEYAGTPPHHADHCCAPGGVDLLGVRPLLVPVPGLDPVPAAGAVAWSPPPRLAASIVGEVCALTGAQLLVRVGVSRR